MLSKSPKKLAVVPASLADLHKLDALFEKEGSNFTSAQPAPALAPGEPERAKSMQIDARQVDATRAKSMHADAMRGDARQGKASQAKSMQADAVQSVAEQAGKPVMYGQKNRIMTYLAPEVAGAVVELAKELDRSESWVAGKLIAEALEARAKK